MFKIIKKLFFLLTPAQRKNFYFLQFLVILTALMEIVGVASIIPFISLIGDMSQLSEDTIYAKAYIASGIDSEFNFVTILGILVLSMLLIASIVSIFTVWQLTKFAYKTGAELADRLYIHYLNQDWLYHASGNSSNLIKKIATETPRTTQGIIVQLMNMNAKIVLSIFVTTTIFLYDPIIAFSGFFIFTFAYFLMFSFVKVRLKRNGQVISDVYQKRFGLMNEGFGGIKDILLLGRDLDFINRFKDTGKRMAYSLGNNAALGQSPRYFIELVAFGSIVILVMYLFITHDGNLVKIVPSLTIYAIASIKLLPAFQQIYSSIADIRANTPAFESIRQDLFDSLKTYHVNLKDFKKRLILKNEISIDNVSFSYSKNDLVLNDLSFKIPARHVVGIVGPSGSGKSTLIDILLGLIEPSDGGLFIDGTKLDNKNKRSWQNNIGFVAQSIFLSDCSIAENIAFGIPKEEIDFDKINKSIQLSHLEDFVESLRDGVNTQVGERGVQLSGGQRQRIGIARSLYNEAEVLIFDEATSSLDGVTEKMIMEAIHEFSGEKTIIMIAHRLKTIEKCDQIFFINKGKLLDQGRYNELIERNELFKNMANHS
jgi:ATP-binding cassette, subfamily B, bacterial PglK